MQGFVRGSLVVAVLTASIQTAIAATPQDMQTEHDVLAAAKERDQARQARLVSSRAEAIPSNIVTAAPTVTDTIQFHIKHIVLQGSPEEFGFLDDHLHAYIDTDMGIFAVQKLAHTLHAELLRKGYVTSQVIVPEQSLAEGTLTLMVEPGRIHAVTYSEDSIKAPWKNAFPIREGDILHIRKLEQGVEQMKRVSSQDVKLRLIPGAERGQTDVELTVTRGKRIYGGVSMDDSGLDSTGKLQVAANVGIDNLFLIIHHLEFLPHMVMMLIQGGW